MFDFAWNYAMPVVIFAYCYARIFHTIRRQRKVLGDHVGRSQDVPMATTSRDPNAGQVQQQATGATTGAKLSRTEMNVVKTMTAVIICFILCWAPASLASVVQSLTVWLFNFCTDEKYDSFNYNLVEICCNSFIVYFLIKSIRGQLSLAISA